jgi:predicted metal-dependent phosphotriesterase family hydrolase
MSTHLKKLVGISVWRGKAYLVSHVLTKSGVFLDAEPVYIAKIDIDELAAAAKSVLSVGIRVVPDPTREEIRRAGSPLLKATKARSWKQIASTGANYEIAWTDENAQVRMSRLDKQGRWEWDPTKTKILPVDTPLRDILKLILADIESRAEVWQ